MSFLADFSPRGICFFDFFSNPFSGATLPRGRDPNGRPLSLPAVRPSAIVSLHPRYPPWHASTKPSSSAIAAPTLLGRWRSSQNLTHNGYDVFFDYTGLASGDFESVILDNIHSRAHFLVLLTPSALERCGEPGDWLRREIEAALDSKRNIVPLMLEGFDFGTPSIANQLTGKLASLQEVQRHDRIGRSTSMQPWRNCVIKFLNVALDTVVQPASPVGVSGRNG